MVAQKVDSLVASMVGMWADCWDSKLVDLKDEMMAASKGVH